MMSKEDLVKEICDRRTHFTFGDNAERLWNEDEEELQDFVDNIKKESEDE